MTLDVSDGDAGWTNAPNREHPVTLSGTISASAEAGAIVVADITIRPDSGAPYEHRCRHAFDLELEDGSLVSVHTASAELSTNKKRTTKGTWTDLEPSFGALVPGFRPGPHVPIYFSLNGFSTGDRVQVEGQVLEQRTIDHNSYRNSASARVPTVVSASKISDCEAPTAAKLRAVPASTTDGRPKLSTFASLAFAAALVVFGLMTPPADWVGALLRISWITFAVTVAGRVLAIWWGYPDFTKGTLSYHYIVSFCTFSKKGSYGSGNDDPAISFAVTIFCLAAIVGLPTLVSGNPMNHMPMTAAAVVEIIGALLGLLLSLLLLIYVHVWTRQSRRIARALLSATVGDARTPGWCALEGRLGQVEWYRGLELGTDGPKSHSFDVTRGPDSVHLYTPGGVIEIQLDGAAFATTGWCQRRVNPRKKRLRLTVQPESRALVAGNLDKQHSRMESTGPESLLVFAAGDRCPRTELRMMLRVQRMLWLAPFVAMAAVSLRYMIQAD